MTILFIFVLGLFSDTGCCIRSSLLTELSDNLIKEVFNYAHIWIAINDYPLDDSSITIDINPIKSQFFNYLSYNAMPYPYEDKEFCTSLIQPDINSAPCEAVSDAIILIDIQGQREEQITFITEVIRNLDLRRNGGAVTVLANSQLNGSISDLIITDDNNLPINISLTSLVYNTTSSQCASCRIAWFDNSMLM